MGESRQELLQWANSLLQLNLTKVEQFGTGAPFCQIYDSIFLDVPMARVKFNVNTEYAYLENFRILSATFRKHQVERTIPVEMLIKCKMQDNLEFLQWTKRYWDQYFSGEEYDAVGRRKGGGAPGPAPGGAGMRASTTRRPAAASAAAPAAARTARPAVGGGGGGGGGASSAVAAKLQAENATLTETVAGLERERDFYFSKLRDIELLVQQAFELEPELEQDEGGILKSIQNILYSTEEGFEIPAEPDEDGAGAVGANEEETF